MKRFLFGMAVTALGAASACNPFAPDDQSVILSVTKLDAPGAISSGAQLTVVLTVTVGGCTRFDHISAVRSASSADLVAWGIDGAKGKTGVGCPAFIADEPHSYTFDPPFQGSFTVQVDRGRVSPLVTTVQIQ
ncbi:MAG TPA: hypothetical protein VGO33_06490 [Gemmatimonadaceae bacterium]|jgi:hypothetical protein|nr:hypothetical protein [Gemmatimonadaceae bacterium]